MLFASSVNISRGMLKTFKKAKSHSCVHFCGSSSELYCYTVIYLLFSATKQFFEAKTAVYGST